MRFLYPVHISGFLGRENYSRIIKIINIESNKIRIYEGAKNEYIKRVHSIQLSLYIAILVFYMNRNSLKTFSTDESANSVSLMNIC